jgi:hypothetical protein
MNAKAARLPAPMAPADADRVLTSKEAEDAADAFERAMEHAAANPKTEDDEVSFAVPVQREETLEELEARLEAIKKQERRSELLAEIQRRTAGIAEKQSRAPIPVSDPVRDAPTTWILMPLVEEEAKVSEAWIDAHVPIKRGQRAMENVLPLSQLRIEDSVMVLVRGKDMRAVKPLMAVTITQQGERLSAMRPEEELMAELTLTPAIHVRDHWVEGAGFGRYSGKLNRATFLEALGKVCVPLCPRFLDQVRKEGHPDNLVLRSL